MLDFDLRYLRTVKCPESESFAQEIVLTQHNHRVATVKQSILIHQDVLGQVTNKLEREVKTDVRTVLVAFTKYWSVPM